MLQRDALNSVLEKNFSIWIKATLVLSFQISFTTIKYFHVSTIRQFILNASPFLVDRFTDILENKAPKPPVIKAFSIEPDVYHAFNSILGAQKDDITLVQAYLQIILARCIPKFQLVEKKSVGSTDLIYRTVSYVSGNFKHSITLESMARDLGVSKYVLSRIFSKTFHKNFNQYLNDARLGYACQRLENTNDTITELCLDSGFKKFCAPFNRAFKEKFQNFPQ